jgi:hypothetical protein
MGWVVGDPGRYVSFSRCTPPPFPLPPSSGGLGEGDLSMTLSTAMPLALRLSLQVRPRGPVASPEFFSGICRSPATALGGRPSLQSVIGLG